MCPTLSVRGILYLINSDVVTHCFFCVLKLKAK